MRLGGLAVGLLQGPVVDPGVEVLAEAEAGGRQVVDGDPSWPCLPEGLMRNRNVVGTCLICHVVKFCKGDECLSLP